MLVWIEIAVQGGSGERAGYPYRALGLFSQKGDLLLERWLSDRLNTEED
jgi:hypothetical protein